MLPGHLVPRMQRSYVNPYERLIFPWPVGFLAQPVKETSVLKKGLQGRRERAPGDRPRSIGITHSVGQAG